MTEIKKRIAALSVAASLLLGVTGCTPIRRTVDENNNITYSGKILLEEVDDLYIIEFINFNNEKKLYLTKKVNLVYAYRFNLLGTETLIATVTEKESDKQLESNYGEIVNIIPFSQYITTYSELKKIYTAEEIFSVFDQVEENYDNLINHKDIKKLELK